jgi:hypothetical protein
MAGSFAMPVACPKGMHAIQLLCFHPQPIYQAGPLEKPVATVARCRTSATEVGVSAVHQFHRGGKHEPCQNGALTGWTRSPIDFVRRPLWNDGRLDCLSAMLEEWTEKLECPRCGKVGSARLSQDMSDDDSIPIVRSVSENFMVDPQRETPTFYCTSCNVWAKP